MKAIKAVYREGQLSLKEPAPYDGPVDVLVVFPEENDNPWEKILAEKTIRPSFARFMKKALKDIAEGKTEPMDYDRL